MIEIKKGIFSVVCMQCFDTIAKIAYKQIGHSTSVRLTMATLRKL